MWWRRADLLSRLDVFVLGLMLVHMVVIVARVSYRCHAARDAEPVDTDNRAFQRARRQLVANLKIRVSSLKSIAQTAPFLGVVGMCTRMLGAFRGVGMEKGAAFSMVVGEIAASLVPAAAGVLVAVPAIWSCNHLRRRIDLLEVGMPRGMFERRGEFQVAQSLPLTRQFSLPPYPLMAGPSLILLVIFTMISRLPTPLGLDVALAPARCPYQSGFLDRIVFLRITKDGELFLNLEKEDWNHLSERLSRIYSLRAQREIYLLADDGVSFQTVADAIDLSRNVPSTEGIYSFDISVRLITPAAMKGYCPEPVMIRSGRSSGRPRAAVPTGGLAVPSAAMERNNCESQ